MSYPTNNLYKNFNIHSLKAIYCRNIILHMLKVNVIYCKYLFMPQHEYNTRLKSNSKN